MTLSCGNLVLASADKVVEIALLESTIDTLQKVYIKQLRTPLEVLIHDSGAEGDCGCDTYVAVS